MNRAENERAMAFWEYLNWQRETRERIITAGVYGFGAGVVAGFAVALAILL